MITKHEIQYDTGIKESFSLLLLKDRCYQTKATALQINNVATPSFVHRLAVSHKNSIYFLISIGLEDKRIILE